MSHSSSYLCGVDVIKICLCGEKGKDDGYNKMILLCGFG